MRELLETLREWQAAGSKVGRAVVIWTYGSAPRQPGSVLLYSSDGRIAGSVSGGCVEGAAAEEIETARRTGKAKLISYGITDEEAWSVGLACGGTIDLLIEPEVPVEAVAAANNRAGAVLVTELPGEQGTDKQRRLVFEHDGGLHGSTGSAAVDSVLTAAADESLLRGSSRVVELESGAFFVEAFAIQPRVVIFGAVEIARALVGLAHRLGFTTVVVDGRAAFATRERFPDADGLVVGWPDEVVDRIALSGQDSVVVLTHDDKFDIPALNEAFRVGCRYVGVIGSKTTQVARRDRLRELGVSEADLGGLHGPIGLDLGGKAPAEIALAILAEIVASRYGASGDSLRDRTLSGQLAG